MITKQINPLMLTVAIWVQL